MAEGTSFVIFPPSGEAGESTTLKTKKSFVKGSVLHQTHAKFPYTRLPSNESA